MLIFFYDYWWIFLIFIVWWVMGVDVGVNFFFVVKFDCFVVILILSGFWLLFCLNICDKWVLIVNFSLLNVVLFYLMNVVINYIF